MSKYKTILVFLITNEFGEGFGLSQSRVQARKQIAWFLPKGIDYKIKKVVAYSKI